MWMHTGWMPASANVAAKSISLANRARSGPRPRPRTLVTLLTMTLGAWQPGLIATQELA